MKQPMTLRACILIAVPVLLAAVTLTSCSTPATAFHFVGNQPVASKAIAGELQAFPGDYTLAANSTSNVSDLHWVITYGTAANPAATPVKTADGVATIGVTFSAPPDATKRYYRTCLSSIAQPSLQTCQNVAAGGNTIWAGNWITNVAPLGFTATQSGSAISLQLFAVGHPGPLVQGNLSSPFFYTETMSGIEIWFEWISNTEIQAHLPGGILGTVDTASFTRTA